ncbi:hypothetical protein BD770DRAFT_444582 [Pilaira anomala]|nr:hypothetical protein BD770DRAFT_444582 [Pilaira anomala]
MTNSLFTDAPLDIYLNSDMVFQRRQTTDAKIKSIDGMEVGLIEAKKPFNTPTKQIEVDVVRLE